MRIIRQADTVKEQAQLTRGTNMIPAAPMPAYVKRLEFRPVMLISGA